MKRVIFVTGNLNKVEEVQSILGDKFLVDHRKLDLKEVQAVKGAEVIKEKAEEAYKILKLPVLVEDVSLYFSAWNNLPGALIKWFVEELGPSGIAKILRGEKNRKATAECSAAFYDGKRMKLVTGEVEGRISERVLGKSGFGWDPIFIPKGFKKSFAQLTEAEKNKISHRRKAWERMRKYLESI